MKIIKKVFVTSFFIILVVFMIFTLANNKNYSKLERRTLATFPKTTLKNALKEKYYNSLTEAFKDQLFARNYLVKGYFLFNFQRYFGTAVKGESNQLYSPVQTVKANHYKKLKNAIELVNKEASNIEAKFIYLSIPRKDAYMIKDLPKNYISSKDIYNRQVKTVKENLNSNIIFIDALEVFEKNNIYNCYYSNDHHITPRCAYLLVTEINKYVGIDTYSLNSTFNIEKTIVNGSYNRQLGQSVKSLPEQLYVTPKTNIKYKRYENNKPSNKKVYGKGNTYEKAYMEGDMAYTKVITNNSNQKKILYVGSSYTNILEALSIPNYKLVASVDYRHNKTGKSINDYVKENDIDYVVFVPSQSTNAFSVNKIVTHLGKK